MRCIMLTMFSPHQVQNPRHGVMGKTFPSEADIESLSKTCSKISSFRANILRTTSFGSVEWEKDGSKWKGGVKEGKGVSQGGEQRMASGIVESEVR